MTKKVEHKGYGPGNTFWYVDKEGEIMRCRWNDDAWCTRTFFNIRDVSERTGEYEFLKLLNEAYEAGKSDQLKIIQNALGIKS